LTLNFSADIFLRNHKMVTRYRTPSEKGAACNCFIGGSDKPFSYHFLAPVTVARGISVIQRMVEKISNLEIVFW